MNPRSFFLLLASFFVAFHVCALDFSATGNLYEALYKPGNVTTVECWFNVDPKCPEGAYVFDKLVESDRCMYRLELGKGTLRLVDTAGDLDQLIVSAERVVTRQTGADLWQWVALRLRDIEDRDRPECRDEASALLRVVI